MNDYFPNCLLILNNEDQLGLFNSDKVLKFILPCERLISLNPLFI